MVSGIRERLTQVKGEFKGIYDQFGKPMAISGESINQLNKAGESVKRLSVEQRQLTEAEKQLNVIQKVLNREVARSTPEYIKAAAAAKAQAQANRQLILEQQKLNGTFKPGVFSTLLTSLKNLALGYLGLSAAIGVVKDVFATTRTLDSLAFSYKVLIKDTNELAQTQAFLSDISKKYGLNILSTSQSYLKFKASITGTNFSLEESEKLFGSVAKAGAVLGLRTDRMELIFLALEQMISKGTISTEELRRQLGDLLPGSMRIMADALGVTIPELLKLIKANKVLAEDALPKFRVALEKAYGIENVTNIDNLNSAIGRFQTSWIEMIKALNASKLSKGIVNLFSDIIDSLTPTDMEGEAMKIYSEQFKNINIEIAKIRKLPSKGVLADAMGRDKVMQEVLIKNLMDVNKQLTIYRDKAKKVKENLTGKAESQAIYIQLKAYEKLSKTLTDMVNGPMNKLFDNKVPAKIVDETLQALLDEEKAATGIINKLEAQKKIKEYLHKQAKDTKVLDSLKQEINYLQVQLDYYNSIGDAVEKKIRKEKNIKIVRPIMIDEFNDVMQKLESKDQQIENDRKSFYESIGIVEEVFYKNELHYLEEAHADKKLTDEQYLKQRAILWMKYNDKLLDSLKQLGDAMFNLSNEILQGQIDKVQREIDLEDTKIDKLKSQLETEKQLKDDGKANDFDRLASQLASEQSLRNSAQKKYEKYQKRQAQLKFLETQANLGISLSEAFVANAGLGPGGVMLAIASAAALITAFVAMQNQIKSIGQYAEGTERVTGPGTETSDSIPVRVSKNERIVKASTNRLLGDISNDDLPDAVNLWRLNLNTDLSKSNYQRHDSVGELIKEYKEHKQISQKLLNAFLEKGDTIPLSNTDKEVSYMVISNSGNKVDIKHFHK